MSSLVDRDELLRRVDLAALLDRVTPSPSSGRGRRRRWRCPHPDHEDRHPSVSIRIVEGVGRWRCWSCGRGGTAIDALICARAMTVGEAIRQLTTIAHVDPILYEPSSDKPVPLHRSVGRYVDACHRILSTNTGRPVLDWLTTTRRLDPEVLEANQVGADPGPRLLRRQRGLPRAGVAAVLPVLDTAGTLAYVQARYLHPTARSKYGNPVGRLGTNPGLAWTVTPTLRHPGRLIVCEGILDALTAATAGLAAVAALGATYPSVRIAQTIADHADGRQVLIAFDGDEPGKVAAARLRQLLAPRGHNAEIVDLPAGTDLNTLAQTTPDWTDTLLDSGVVT
ncbi:MAG: toprim domain-containing protein [Actinomycetota bacterium]